MFRVEPGTCRSVTVQEAENGWMATYTGTNSGRLRGYDNRLIYGDAAVLLKDLAEFLGEDLTGQVEGGGP